MYKRLAIGFAGFLFAITFHSAQASIILADWAYNVDGTTSENYLGDSMPTTGILDGSGLGTLTYQVTGSGNHNFIAWFDFEIDQSINTFFNEYGVSTGTLAAGQSYEVDEPGWIFGNIYDNVTIAGLLDNSNTVPSGAPDDVSFALGWNFDLALGETATITLNLADLLPVISPSFYLTHADVNSPDTIYFWSSLSIEGAPTGNVPEPASLALFGIGLLGLAASRKKAM